MMLQRKLEARLEEVAMGPDAEPAADGQAKALLKVAEGGPMPALDRFIGGTTRGSALGRWIEQSGVKTTISAMLLDRGRLWPLPSAVVVMLLVKAQWGFLLGGHRRLRAAVHVPEHEAHASGCARSRKRSRKRWT